MAKNDARKNGFEKTNPEDLAAKEEKFRTFFSTSVAQVPDEMKHRDDEKQEPAKQKTQSSILGRILGRAKEEAEPAPEKPAMPQELPPTGEIRLGGEDEAAEPKADLELAADFFVAEEPESPVQPAPAAPAERKSAAEKQPAPQPQQPKYEKNYVRGPLTPQEQKEHAEMQELKALLFPAPKPARPEADTPAPQEVLGVETAALEAEEKACAAMPKMVFAEDRTRKSEPEEARPEPTQPFRFFGEGDDEAAPAAPTRETPSSMDDSMSIPLVGLEEEPEAPVSAPDATPAEAAQPAEAAAKAAPGEASAAETPAAPAEEAAEESAEESIPETVGEKLHKMSAELTLRCVLSGILAVVLLHFGLTAAGLLAPIASLDPVVAPAAFYAANLLVLAAAGTVLGVQGWKLYRATQPELPAAQLYETLSARPGFTTCDAIPQTYIDAVIAVEDSRFELHHGVDPVAIVRALWTDLRTRSLAEGGSTLTQQLAKNIYFTQEKRFARKAAELFAALDIEKHCSKQQIFEMYVNTIYFGSGCYGIAEAAEGYFGKTPAELTSAECVLLAGLPNAPSAYSPHSSPELALKRSQVVLDRMVSCKKLTKTQARELQDEIAALPVLART